VAGPKLLGGEGLAGGSLVLARFFFGSFLFINGKEMNGKPLISGMKLLRKPNLSCSV
tara:strand:- start:403 stop:573 length:171 start_codon:yes stop_codon:yes gene_type:complete